MRMKPSNLCDDSGSCLDLQTFKIKPFFVWKNVGHVFNLVTWLLYKIDFKVVGPLERLEQINGKYVTAFEITQ